jgi:hypothetical protein
MSRALIHLQAVIFVQQADDEDSVPTLKKKQYSDFKLSRSEWEKIKLIHEVLAVC